MNEITKLNSTEMFLELRSVVIIYFYNEIEI
jgi:hypothetical protein